MILDKKVTVNRLNPSSNVGGQEVYVTHSGFISGVAMNIQPANAEFTAMSDGQFFKTYKAFTTNSGIVEGFQVVVSGTGEQYIVRGRESYNYGSGKHYELALEKAIRGNQ